MIAAGIDIGSNTLRLLIAKVLPQKGRLEPIFKLMRITRLAEGMPRDGGPFLEKAMARTISALEEFSGAISQHSVLHTFAHGTWALRNASNSAEFLKLVSKRTGIKVEVISAEKEAELTLMGIAGAGTQASDFVAIDIGGGSTEFTLGSSTGNMLHSHSATLGVVNFAERYLVNDPPEQSSLSRMENEIGEHVGNIMEEVLQAASDHDVHPKTLIGTAGTSTTLASLALGLEEYEPEKIHGSIIDLKKLEELYSKLTGMTFNERAALIPLKGGREDLILPGAVIVIATIKALGLQSITVSDAGLLEGIIINGVSGVDVEPDTGRGSRI